MNKFNSSVRDLIFDKIPLKRITEELISELKNNCKEIDENIFEIFASSRINGEDIKRYEVNTNKQIYLTHYEIRVYEIDKNSTSIYFVLNWEKNPKEDYFKGLGSVCYFDVEYQILNGEQIKYITYDTFYS